MSTDVDTAMEVGKSIKSTANKIGVPMQKTVKLKKERVTKEMIKEVVTYFLGDEALPFVNYLKDKTKISEFIIAEELEVEIHRTRHILYKLLENNLATFIRKKDKLKGWYICYWDFNEGMITYLHNKMVTEQVDKMKDRLDKEKGDQFFMCRNACTRMNFEKATEYLFKCPECGEIMQQLDNSRTIQFLEERIKALEAE